MGLTPGMSALVTGGANGIGKAIGLALAKNGLFVTVVDFSEARGTETASLIEKENKKFHPDIDHPSAIFIKCDVTNTGDVSAAFEKHVATYGGLDICINSAGVGTTVKRFDEDETDGINTWRRIISINFVAVIDCTRIARESERNSANRSSNPVTHRGGSKSFQHHREDLERIRGGSVSYWDVFVHTHAERDVDDSGSVSYNWGGNPKARESYDKFIQARATMLDDTGRDDLTPDEEDAIFESIMDPPTRGRRYGFGNQAARTSQLAFQKAQEKEEIAQLRAEVAELRERDFRREKVLEELQQKWETFYATYGHPPSSGGSGND